MRVNIRTKKSSLSDVLALPTPKHSLPKKPWRILRSLIRLLSLPELLSTHFSFSEERMELVGDKPCLILMNHSGFVDLKLAFHIFAKKPFCTVSTADSFIGMPWLMRMIGCIPTHKFVSDVTLMSDIKHTLEVEKASVLLYPEAGYSLDGRATALQPRFSMLFKRLGVPVVTVTTDGAFLRQPLFNELRRRRTRITAKVKCILTPEEIAEKSVSELDEMVSEAFSFDGFASQLEKGVAVDERTRAKGLERVLYKCPHCGRECCMASEDSEIYCSECGARYELDTLGRLVCLSGEGRFDSVTDWYDFERESVREEILQGTYRLDTEVDISVIRDYRALYLVGRGRLVHDAEGLTLFDETGETVFHRSPIAAHSLNVDFYWYKMGDIIGLGDRETLYCCFTHGVSVAKARLAAEELYKIKRASTRRSGKPDSE